MYVIAFSATVVLDFFEEISARNLVILLLYSFMNATEWLEITLHRLDLRYRYQKIKSCLGKR